MIKMTMAFLAAAMILSIFSAFMDGGGGVNATTITSAVTNTDTHIDVTSTTGFLASGIAWVQSEKIAYTTVNTTAFLNVTRGYESTTAKSHPLTTSNGQAVHVYSETAGIVNKAIGFDIGTMANTGGWTAIPMILKDFFVYTLPKLISWNYSFLQEGTLLILLRYVLMAISIGLLIAFCFQLGNLIVNTFK